MPKRKPHTDPKVDAYFAKSKRWVEESELLRQILLSCDVDEVFKWGKPCYAHAGDNLCIIQKMKTFVALMFFKGALLDDPDELLESQGPNTRSALRLCFTDTKQVRKHEAAIKRFVKQAIEVEKKGLKVEKPKKLDLAAELEQRLTQDPELEAAFRALTPGRQREYNLHICGAKQSKTRAARVAKHIPKILAGKGMRDP